MVRFDVQHRGNTYTVSPDDPVPASHRFQSIVSMRLVDELTGDGVNRGVALHTSEFGLQPHIGPGGLAGLVGVPRDAVPQLDATAYDIDYEITGDRFVPMARRVSLPVQANYPDTFDPQDIGDVMLHATSTLIGGRVVEDDGNTRTPAQNAPVTITRVWRRLPPTPPPNTFEDPDMAVISPPLYAGRGSLIGTLREREMLPAGGPALRVVQTASAGQARLRLLASTGLNPGDVAEVEFLDPARPHHDPEKIEYLRIAAIDRVNQSLPSTLEFDHAMAFSHDEGVSVRLVNPQAAGANIPFSRDALANEACVFLDNLVGLPGVSVVEITGDTDLDGNALAPEIPPNLPV